MRTILAILGFAAAFAVIFYLGRALLLVWLLGKIDG